jgi:hypothetical protein
VFAAVAWSELALWPSGRTVLVVKRKKKNVSFILWKITVALQ